MPNGRLVKQHLDEAIDECDKLQNLRQAIIQCKRAADRGGDEERPAAFWNARGSNYLHRYIYLIIYTAYLLEEVRVSRPAYALCLPSHSPPALNMRVIRFPPLYFILRLSLSYPTPCYLL
mmetsp:Transcript_8219/g.21836  ORF Transcript_8219/g.21836 Transcript_8219/m.21836 type:complete len:120 (-) Transcript_8219:583-942(-)